ncbi:MAG TPA: pro-sigmaK processing inhibitor BofA [Firmicutes bacterium]|nr:pro-sigmaK processing inhibitor BofA [Bacillota bacterium]
MALTTILAYLLGLGLLAIIAYILLIPLKLLARLVLNGILGGALLWLFNLVGIRLGVTVPVNPVTALVAGLLGVPGVILLAALRYFLVL